MDNPPPILDALRGEIDRLDEQIVRLLNDRARCVVEIGRLKAATASSVFAADREQQILDRIRRISGGPLPDESLLAIYRELMSASFALERPPRIAFLGPSGSYSHEAGLGKFGASVEYVPLADIAGVFEAVTRRHADYGVVPIENSLGGPVAESLESLAETEAKICCEIHRQIHHNLLVGTAAEPGDKSAGSARLTAIEAVYSKPEAFVQCRRFLAETGLHDRTVPVSSTSKAAEMVRDQSRAAAIAGAAAARLFGLHTLHANIEDSPNNTTRFLVIGRESARPSGDDRSSITFTTTDRAGALADVLLVLQRFGVNMTMITSRRSRALGQEYLFFADVEGHADAAPLRDALDEARRHCAKLRVLGSYPRSRDVAAT